MKNRISKYALLVLISGLATLVLPGWGTGVRAESLFAEALPVQVPRFGFISSGILGVKPFDPIRPLTSKYPPNHRSQPVSNECYFKEAIRVAADKGPESAIIVLSGLFIGFPLPSVSLQFHPVVETYDSPAGGSFRIRPPPSSN